MVEREDIIICDGISKDKYIIAIKKAVIYGILSVPYTIDRMGYGNSPDGVKKRIINIAKGKIGEFLFEQYCINKGFQISRSKTETPFWKYDKNDFIINGITVDLKNNYVYSFRPEYTNELPALVPETQFNKVKPFEFYYVFSFLPKNNDDFFDIHLTKESLKYIGSLNNNCCGEQLNHKPEYFTTEKEWFKNFFDTYGKCDKVVTFSSNLPQLVIGGYASRKDGDFDEFKLVNPDSLKTLGGNIYTKVKNYFTPIKTLRPFIFETNKGGVFDESYYNEYNEILELFD